MLPRVVPEEGVDLQTGTGRQRRGVDDHDVPSGGGRGHHAAQQLPALALAAATGVTLARRVLLAAEGDAGRDAVGAQPLLEPGRVAQLADGDLNSAVRLPGDCPGRQLGMRLRWRGGWREAPRSRPLPPQPPPPGPRPRRGRGAGRAPRGRG